MESLLLQAWILCTVLQDFAGLLFTSGEGIGCCRSWLGAVDPVSHVMAHKKFQTKPTAVGRLLTADPVVMSWIEFIKNSHSSVTTQALRSLQFILAFSTAREGESWMSRERQTSSTRIFGYKRVKRANWAGSAEKQQQKANCALLGRGKVRADAVRLRSVTQGKPKSRNFPDMGANGTKIDKSRTLHGKYEI